jgi:hypothetical protein
MTDLHESSDPKYTAQIDTADQKRTWLGVRMSTKCHKQTFRDIFASIFARRMELS